VGAQEFGRLVDRVIRERGLSQADVGIDVGRLPDGRKLNEKAVERIRRGGRRLDHVLVQTLIDKLDLDPAEAWAKAGLWPPDLDETEYRRLRESGRPLEPALTHARGGSDTPTAPSLRPDQRGSFTSRWKMRAGHRTHRHAPRPVRTGRVPVTA
jgi:hypothetical protein